VCRGIVEAAKGRIFVDAAYDKGARFVVELPASVSS
jgi:signal transduction histidine kinase